jgi:hypothetical protein
MLLQRSSHILSDVGEDIGGALASHLEEEGIEVVVGLDIVSVASQDNKITVTARDSGKASNFRSIENLSPLAAALTLRVSLRSQSIYLIQRMADSLPQTRFGLLFLERTPGANCVANSP